MAAGRAEGESPIPTSPSRPTTHSQRSSSLFSRQMASTSLVSLLGDDSTRVGSRCTQHRPPRDQESPGPNLPPSHVSGFSYPARFVKFQSPPAIFDDLLRRLVRFLLGSFKDCAGGRSRGRR